MNIKVYDNGGTRKARYLIYIPHKKIKISCGRTPQDYWKSNSYQMSILGEEWKEIPLFNLSLEIRQAIFNELQRRAVKV